MYNDKIQRYLIRGLAIACALGFIYLALNSKSGKCPTEIIRKNEPLSLIGQARELLRVRKNIEALVILDKILSAEPNNMDAIWGRAEVFRRSRQDKIAELMFKDILNSRPGYAPALISLSYIKYNNGDFKGALRLIEQTFVTSGNNRQNQALAYMMLGLIDNITYPKTGMISGINHSLEVRGYLLKATRLAPELPEIHLNLGIFYLKTPVFAGGGPNKAIRELERTVSIAPEFSEANARLAQAYRKKKGKNYFAGF